MDQGAACWYGGARMITLADLQRLSWHIAEEKGHHKNLRSFPAREATLIPLGLVHTEVSEAMQEVKRHGVSQLNLDTISHELADILVRVGDLAQELGIDLTMHVDAVM